MICFLQKYIFITHSGWAILSYINSYYVCTYLFANQLQGLCFLLKVAFTGGQVLFHWHIATGKWYLILHHSYIGACMLHNNLLMLWSHVLPCCCDQYCQLLDVLKGHEHSVFMVNSTLHFGHGSSSASIAELRRWNYTGGYSTSMLMSRCSTCKSIMITDLISLLLEFFL